MKPSKVRRQIGRALGQARAARGMTQTQLGASLQPPVWRTTVSRWERGERMPDALQLLAIGMLLQTSCDALLGRVVAEVQP